MSACNYALICKIRLISAQVTMNDNMNGPAVCTAVILYVFWIHNEKKCLVKICHLSLGDWIKNLLSRKPCNGQRLPEKIYNPVLLMVFLSSSNTPEA